jgi:hypothetical protein
MMRLPGQEGGANLRNAIACSASGPKPTPSAESRCVRRGGRVWFQRYFIVCVLNAAPRQERRFSLRAPLCRIVENQQLERR